MDARLKPEVLPLAASRAAGPHYHAISADNVAAAYLRRGEPILGCKSHCVTHELWIADSDNLD